LFFAVTHVGSQPASAQSAPLPLSTELERLHSVADVVDAVAPSVVNVFTTTQVRREREIFPFDDPLFRRFFGDVPPLNRNTPDRAQTSLGSGVVYSADGLIVTNNHVVAAADAIRVSLPDGREFDAELVGADESSDLALLRIDASDLEPVRWGDSLGLRVGDGVLAIGNPFGLGETVTLGIVSAKGRSLGLVEYEDFIQTDASINPGNSGGPLVNLRGEVIGINSAILSRSGGSQGIGFAIPGYLVERVIDNLQDHGRMVRGFLGIFPQQLTPDLARAASVDANRGVMVSDVIAGSPAEKAGFEQGDVIVRMNGRDVVDMMPFRTTIGHMAPGDRVEFEVLRDGKRRTLEVELGERPSNVVAGAPSGPQFLDLGGFEVQDLDRRLAARFGVESDRRGAVVTSVEPASTAQRAGLRVGDLILEVARERVENAAEMRRAIVAAVEKHGDGDATAPILLLVERQGTTLYLAFGPLDG
jgi:serine protease Do